jgi:LPS sulfotransferase NodH
VEFEHGSDARRAAWVWRSYATAVRSSGVPHVEIRYEQLASDPAAVADVLADALDVPLQQLTDALGRAHDTSVGRYRTDLDERQLTDVEAEAGHLLGELGYVR